MFSSILKCVSRAFADKDKAPAPPASPAAAASHVAPDPYAALGVGLDKTDSSDTNDTQPLVRGKRQGGLDAREDVLNYTFKLFQKMTSSGKQGAARGEFIKLFMEGGKKAPELYKTLAAAHPLGDSTLGSGERILGATPLWSEARKGDSGAFMNSMLLMRSVMMLMADPVIAQRLHVNAEVPGPKGESFSTKLVALVPDKTLVGDWVFVLDACRRAYTMLAKERNEVHNCGMALAKPISGKLALLHELMNVDRVGFRELQASNTLQTEDEDAVSKALEFDFVRSVFQRGSGWIDGSHQLKLFCFRQTGCAAIVVGEKILFKDLEEQDKKNKQAGGDVVGHISVMPICSAANLLTHPEDLKSFRGVAKTLFSDRVICKAMHAGIGLSLVFAPWGRGEHVSCPTAWLTAVQGPTWSQNMVHRERQGVAANDPEEHHRTKRRRKR